MIHYTPLSEHEIFPTSEEDYGNRQCISYDGKPVYVDKNEDGTYQLVQLLSTDPQDFLNERYLPGTFIP
jgi:YlzJ-like protein